MNKVFVSVLSLIALVFTLLSPASAQLLIGAKAAGMGGAGVANVTDLSAVYYNPAGLMENTAKLAEMKISLGAAYSDPTTLQKSLTNAKDPAQFLLDNYANNLNFNGTTDGIIGFNFAKIGISVIPNIHANVKKPANSTAGTFEGNGRYDVLLTLGTTIPVPFVGQLDIGANAKSITDYRGSIEAVLDQANPLLSTGTLYNHNGTGMGYDIGALASINIPMLTNVKVGYSMRDLSASIKYSNKSQLFNINKTTGTVTSDAQQTLAETTSTLPTANVIGASATIPVIGAAIAADVESINGGSNTHVGIEYPILMSAVILRAGSATGPALNMTTFGAKINFPVLTLDVAMISNNNDKALSQAVIDINIGL